MKTDSISIDAVSPIFLRFAVARSAETPLPGRYDQEANVWVVDQPTGTIALIAAASQVTDLATKTRSQQEQDDESINLAIHCGTKTKAQLEREDLSINDPYFLVELSTKTATPRERDDK